MNQTQLKQRWTRAASISALSRPVGAAAGALALALLTWLLHGSALQGGWRFDDPAHLQFAASHTPWQYFTQRLVMLQQSYAHITPWNAFFYEMGLPWFGMNPRGHYLHLLAVLWAAAMATWLLLRRWLQPPVALMGAALFLSMPPTAAVAQLLMTGHYAYGLLFSALAFHWHAQALDSKTSWSAYVAAAWYGLACLCKELYVPLVLVAAVIAVLASAPSPTQRWRAFLPWLGVALAYTTWRIYVVGGVGGYASLRGDGGPVLLGWLAALQAALASLLGQGLSPGWLGMAILAAMALIVTTGWRWGRRPAWLVLLAALISLLGPIWPQFRISTPDERGRLLLLVGWAIALLCAWQLQGWWQRGLRRRATLMSGGLIALLAVGQAQTVEQITRSQTITDAQYRVLSEGRSSLLVPHGFSQANYLSLLADAAERVEGFPAAEIIDDEDAFLALGPVRGPTAWSWQDDCACVRSLGPRYAERSAAILRALEAGQCMVKEVRLSLASRGLHRNFQWHLNAPPGQLFVHVQGYTRLALPSTGALAFGLDNTAQLRDPVRLRVLLQTPEGALSRTPWLELPLNGDSSIEWAAPLQTACPKGEQASLQR